MKILTFNNIHIIDEIKVHLKAVIPELQIVFAETFEEAIKILHLDKDIKFIAIDMDNINLNWKLCVKEISKKFEKHRIIVFANSKNIDDIEYCMKNRVSAFIPKDFSPELSRHALSFILAGGNFYPTIYDERARAKVRLLNEDNHQVPHDLNLTNRQGEVLINLCRGLSNKQIAHEMNVAEATVKLHVNALLRSLNVTNRTHAVVRAQKLGIV